MYYDHMYLGQRDREILGFASRFGAVTPDQIYHIFFHGLSKTPRDRAIKRLYSLRLLKRYERPAPGGARGGSGQYIYRLPQTPPRPHQLRHTLAIGDSYVAIRQLEHAGAITIEDYGTEPDNWVMVGGVELRPDLYVQVKLRSGEGRRRWLEIDLATESLGAVQAKLTQYYAAYQNFNNADFEQWGDWLPTVVFVTEDDARARWLAKLIDKQPEDARPLFEVAMLSTLPAVLTGSYPQE